MYAEIFRSDTRHPPSERCTTMQLLSELRRCYRTGEAFQISHLELAKRLRRSESTISEAMRKLEAAGQLSRVRDHAGAAYTITLIAPPEARIEQPVAPAATADDGAVQLALDLGDEGSVRGIGYPIPPSFLDHAAPAAAAPRASRWIEPLTLVDEEPMAQASPPMPQSVAAFCSPRNWHRLWQIRPEDVTTVQDVESQILAAARRGFRDPYSAVFNAFKTGDIIDTPEEIAARVAAASAYRAELNRQAQLEAEAKAQAQAETQAVPTSPAQPETPEAAAAVSTPKASYERNTRPVGHGRGRTSSPTPSAPPSHNTRVFDERMAAAAAKRLAAVPEDPEERRRWLDQRRAAARERAERAKGARRD